MLVAVYQEWDTDTVSYKGGGGIEYNYMVPIDSLVLTCVLSVNSSSVNSAYVKSVLLHNGEVCNGCITKRFCSYRLSRHDNNNIMQNMTNISIFFCFFYLLSSISCETISLYDTFHHNLRKQHFVMQPLQNPPLCISNVKSHSEKSGSAVLPEVNCDWGEGLCNHRLSLHQSTHHRSANNQNINTMPMKGLPQ